MADRENTPEKRVARNECPECSGDLDTGYECTRCGYDAEPIARGMPFEPAKYGLPTMGYGSPWPPASADTHAKRGDAAQTAAPSPMSGAVASAPPTTDAQPPPSNEPEHD